MHCIVEKKTSKYKIQNYFANDELLSYNDIELKVKKLNNEIIKKYKNATVVIIIEKIIIIIENIDDY